MLTTYIHAADADPQPKRCALRCAYHRLALIRSPLTAVQVKGGGHTANPGFSSTTGVQVALNRFGGVTYDESTGIASVGAGNVWDNVYEALEPYSVNVVGGRVSGVGIAGFILGGGTAVGWASCVLVSDG